jgi:16S rRNA (cytosine967-C5)-methyltransferase
MTTLPPARLRAQATLAAATCADILWEALALGRPADRALAAALRANRRIGGRDRRLISETLFAVLRWWGWIEPLAPSEFTAALAICGPGSPPSASPAVRASAWAALLAAAWTLEGGEVPEAARLWLTMALPQASSASVAEAGMPLERRSRLLVPFLPAGTPPPEPGRLLPAWAWQEMDCPRPAAELLEWLQRRPPVWLRAQTTDLPGLIATLRSEGVEVQPHGALPTALSTPPPRVNLRTLGPFVDGLVEVQDLASQLVGHVCAPRAGQRWWDACAGAGGKTLHLADLMARKGSVTASDLRTYKLEDLHRRARRAGFPNIRTRPWQGKALPEDRGQFDGVLVDAPCSCSGTWRRNPDGRWTLRQAELAEFTAIQGRLLANAGRAVRPGGVLVYATCSLFRAENAGVVDAFLAVHPEFRLEPFPQPLSGAPVAGMLQTWPWDGDCDAMFIARFRRSGPSGCSAQ